MGQSQKIAASKVQVCDVAKDRRNRRKRDKVVARAVDEVCAASTKNKGATDRAPKRNALIAMLSGRHGVSIAEIATALGWLPHTTRAALTGLRHKGFEITREAGVLGSIYRIIDLEKPNSGGATDLAGVVSDVTDHVPGRAARADRKPAAARAA